MRKKPIILTEEEITFLTNVVKTSPKELYVRRAKSILLAHKGLSYPEIASAVSGVWTAVAEALAVWRKKGVAMFATQAHSNRKRLQDVPESEIEKLREIAQTSLDTSHRLLAQAILLYKDFTPEPKIMELCQIETYGRLESLLSRFRKHRFAIFEPKKERKQESIIEIRNKIVHCITDEDFRRCSSIYYDSTNNALRRRAYILVLRYKRYSHAEIAKKVFSDEAWVERALEHYEQHGLEAMLHDEQE